MACRHARFVPDFDLTTFCAKGRFGPRRPSGPLVFLRFVCCRGGTSGSFVGGSSGVCKALFVIRLHDIVWMQTKQLPQSSMNLLRVYPSSPILPSLHKVPAIFIVTRCCASEKPLYSWRLLRRSQQSVRTAHPERSETWITSLGS